MRRLLAVCIVIGILTGAAALAGEAAWEFQAQEAEGYAPQTAESIRYAEVATQKGTLNMRSAPNDKAKIISRLPRGAIVRIVQDMGDWTEILYGGESGYVMTAFLAEITELPYSPIVKGDKGEAVLAFKRALHKLGYLKAEDVNSRYDWELEYALTKLQLMNGLALNPELVTPEVQALMEWGKLVKGKSGYLDTATDAESGLTVAIFCWDTAGVLYESDKSVKLTITYAVQAIGGQGPYTITVRKSVSGTGAEYGDEVENPFSHIWSQSTERLYVYATAIDAAGNTVTACAPFRYALPERYAGD